MRGTLAAIAAVAALASAAPARGDVSAARAYAGDRAGHVAFAVVRPGRELTGLHGRDVFPSASVAKAMLLVAVLRTARDRPLTAAERAEVEPMILRSANRPARALHARLGDGALATVGRLAGMRDLRLVGALFETGITAADQARFFWRLERIVPARHRAYALELLGGIVERQAWGIPAALRPDGWAVIFKGGWRRGIVHQVALVRRGDERMALAVLTSGGPSRAYGAETIAGIARRVTRSGRPSSDTSGRAGP